MGKSITDLSSVTTVGLDLAKHVFQVHGVDASGRVVVAKAIRHTMFAYSGTYTVESDRLVHHVDLSWNEAWSGTDQVRFCKVDEQTLTYTSTPAKNPFDGREIVHEVTWERE